jgi:hypothetical protein
MTMPLHEQVYVTFLRNLYELVILILAWLSFIVVTRLNRRKAQRVSRLAVISAVTGLINPVVVYAVVSGLHCFVYPPQFNPIRSFLFGAFALGAGIVAAVRIRRSHGAQRGKPFCVVGIVTGGLWTIFWIGLLLTLILAFGVPAPFDKIIPYHSHP